MKLQYCHSSKGILLLNQNTHTEWRAISPTVLFQNMCVVTILPAKYTESYFVLAQNYYVPKNFYDSAGLLSKSVQLYKFLQTNAQRTLKVMPSVKYSLDGVQLNMIKTIELPDGAIVIEGIIKLVGDMVVKPTKGLNSMLLSLNDKTGQVTLIGAEQARTEFISSLKISNYLGGLKPSLTISSSLTDKVSMLTTSIQLTPENMNSFKINARCIPNYYEIKNRFGLTLEIKVGYEFSGKVTYYKSLPDLMKSSGMLHNNNVETKIIANNATRGSIIMCVFDTLAAGLLLAV